MIGTEPGMQLLIRTIVDADMALTRWAQRLSSNRNLELGGDPDLVDAIEDDLRQLAQKMHLLEPQFDLSRVPLSKANHYFDATQQLDDVVALVREIREESYGSYRNTRKCLAHITRCAESVRDMSMAMLSSLETTH
jgi:thiamine biosynthesis lipoprotein ApbE